MKKTNKNDATTPRNTAAKPAPKPQSRFTGKPAKKPQKKPMTVLEKRDAEALGMKQAHIRRAEQEMLTLSHLSNFGAAQEQMLNNRMAQIMHKIGHVKLPFLRMAFMARSRRILGRQQPRIEGRKAQSRLAKKTRFKQRMSLTPFS